MKGLAPGWLIAPDLIGMDDSANSPAQTTTACGPGLDGHHCHPVQAYWYEEVIPEHFDLPVHRPLVLSPAHGENDGMPQRISLDALAREQLKLAAGAGGGHTAHTVYGGHEKVLRQTVIAMVHGSELSEHENPDEATVLVLHGRVRMSAGELAWEGSRGDLITVPDARHRLKALEDSAVLLTVAKLP